MPLYCIFKDLLAPRPVQLTAHEREYAELICSRIMSLGEMHGKFEIPISDQDWDNAKRRFDPEGDRNRRSAGLADLRQFLIDVGELNMFYVHEDPTKKGPILPTSKKMLMYEFTPRGRSIVFVCTRTHAEIKGILSYLVNARNVMFSNIYR